jgi:hypothetical protein
VKSKKEREQQRTEAMLAKTGKLIGKQHKRFSKVRSGRIDRRILAAERRLNRGKK